MSNVKAFDRSAPRQSKDGWLQAIAAERIRIRIRARTTPAGWSVELNMQ
jgi:hypothetical protein